MQLPPLKGLQAFSAAARLGSVTKAADELNLTVSAVSHQLAGLEEYLGGRLFERSPRGLTLTPLGERFNREASSALAMIVAAVQGARSAETIETLRVHSSPSFASLWLMPRLPRFRADHPTIRIQLSAAHTHSDFAQGDVDLDIRYGAIRWPDLHVETICVEEVLPLVSPRLLERREIRTPEDLLQEDLIFSAVNLVQWPKWFAAHGVPNSPATYSLRFDRAYLSIDAAVQGMGIALESARMAEAALAQGALVPVFEERRGIEAHAHHLVYPKAHGAWPKVERFVRWIREEAARGSPAPVARR